MFASDKIVKAALMTTHRGLVFIRNLTLSRQADVKCVNSLAEALHEVPAMVQGLEHFPGGEEELLRVLRNHLACFDHTKWPNSPNLLVVFNDELSRA
jgi:hypothetical protein